MKKPRFFTGSAIFQPGIILFFAAQSLSLIFLLQKDLNAISDISDLFYLFGLYAGISALVFLISCAIFSLRHPLSEKFSGGLDNLYRLHHFSAIWAVFFTVVHLIFLTLSNLLVSKEAALYLFQIWHQSWDLIFGWISALLLLLVSLLSLILERGHRLWRPAHLLGIPCYIFAFCHFNSYTTLHGFLKIFIYTSLLLGFAFLLYGVFKNLFACKYVVRKIEHLDKDNVVITLAALGRKLKYHSSQFVFATFHSSDAYKACNEPHPFTIISSPDQTELELIIKARGDCTCRLQNLAEGVKVDIEGPYGGFENESENQLWIAGGVGISSFVSLLKNNNLSNVDLYYITKNRSEQVLLPKLEKAAQDNKNISIHTLIVDSNPGEILSEIRKKTPDFFKRTCFLSGPVQMIKSLKAILTCNGMPAAKIKHENFGFFMAKLFLFFLLSTFVTESAASAEDNKIIFDKQQVLTHDSEQSCWMIINDNVYDLTSYIPKHPAPARTIVDHCGKEATFAFNTKEKARPHSKRASELLSGYMIGTIKTD